MAMEIKGQGRAGGSSLTQEFMLPQHSKEVTEAGGYIMPNSEVKSSYLPPTVEFYVTRLRPHAHTFTNGNGWVPPLPGFLLRGSRDREMHSRRAARMSAMEPDRVSELSQN